MTLPDASRPHVKILNPTLLIVSLGYFIDMFDLFLFNAVRSQSLHDLGLSGDELTRAGMHILNMQVFGMLLGGFLWGVLGDKIGRKKALIYSVLLYSLGSLGCAFVHGVMPYMAMRLLTGIGLAGEFGLGAILAVETLPDAKRNWALAIFSMTSAIAVFAVNGMAEVIPWRWCYAAGGIGGLLLMLVRMKISESGLFAVLAARERLRGSLRLLLSRPNLLKRWLCCIFLIMPQVFVTNMLMTLAPEFGRALGVQTPVTANIALMVYFSCQALADVMAVWLCIRVQRRLPVLWAYVAAATVMTGVYLTLDHPTALFFYAICAVMGLCSFYMLYRFMAVEQFGTDMRATAGTSALSIGRTTLIIPNTIFLALRGAGLDLILSAGIVAALVFGIGFISLLGFRETYHQSLDFLEESP